MRTGNTRRAYAIALKERGNLLHKRDSGSERPDRNDRAAGHHAAGRAERHRPRRPSKRFRIPRCSRCRGQYIVHDVDNLVLPYLPDPMADGVALVFYRGRRRSPPRQPAGAAVRHGQVRRDLARTAAAAAGVAQRAAGWMPARTATSFMSDCRPASRSRWGSPRRWTPSIWRRWALWRFHPVHDPNVPEADRRVLERAAPDGWLWWLTPDEDLRLVHATARPAIAPTISRLIAEPRKPYIVTANLDGVIDVHGASTDKVELRAKWDDSSTIPTRPSPPYAAPRRSWWTTGSRKHETVLVADRCSRMRTRSARRRISEVSIRTAIHNLPDTKARKVTYRLHGSSRYREFFPPDELPTPDDEASAGNEVEVNVPSSAPPRRRWCTMSSRCSCGSRPPNPSIRSRSRRIRRSGVRIWLERPWYSSGEGEMLAVITTGDPRWSRTRTKRSACGPATRSWPGQDGELL